MWSAIIACLPFVLKLFVSLIDGTTASNKERKEVRESGVEMVKDGIEKRDRSSINAGIGRVNRM